MVHEDLKLSKILTREAFENAIRVNGALGGSTNAVIHLIAIAGRVGVPMTLEDWDRIGRDTPTLVDIMPSGRFLMEDFYYAGEFRLSSECWRNTDYCMKARSRLRERRSPKIASTRRMERRGDSTVEKPLVEHGGIAVLRGNLAPDGAVLKPSAASPHLMKHRGRAVVFQTIEQYNERILDPYLDIDENSVMVLQNCGPRAIPAWPSRQHVHPGVRVARGVPAVAAPACCGRAHRASSPRRRWR